MSALSEDDIAQMAADLVNQLGEKWEGREPKAYASYVTVCVMQCMLREVANIPADACLRAATKAVEIFAEVEMILLRKDGGN